MRGHMTGGFCFTKLIRMAPLPSVPDTRRCMFVVVSLGLPDEISELRETEFFTLAMTDARIQTQGCRPQSPALSAAPCCYVLFCWDGERHRENPELDERIGRISDSKCAQAMSYLPGCPSISAGYLFSQEMGKGNTGGQTFPSERKPVYF